MVPKLAEGPVVTAEELKGRFGKRPLVVCDATENLAGTIHRLREGTSLRELFLAAVLAGLVLEAFVANRVTGSKPGKPLGR
jgi:hypothetical protein